MDSALAAHTVLHSAADGSGAAKRLQDELKPLQARERATADAQIAGIAADADAAAHARMLGDIASQRKTLQARLDRLAPAHTIDDRPRLQSMAGVFHDMVGQAREVLTAPEAPIATCREVLGRVIHSVAPGDGGVYVQLRPLHESGILGETEQRA